MYVLHVSAECYPVAKVGGLADVVGALPKYQRLAGIDARVVIPFYNKPFVQNHTFSVDYHGTFWMHTDKIEYQVLRLNQSNELGFPLYMVLVPQVLDRAEVYAYEDDWYRFLCFQNAVLNWIKNTGQIPDLIHCHDHHSGLIPFMMQHCQAYDFMKKTASIGTIHNAQYQGQMSWDKVKYLPPFDDWKYGLLEWNGAINSLASLVKCSWAFSTVSEGYLGEIFQSGGGLESLFRSEGQKAWGIINGIDAQFWNPETDKMLFSNYNMSNVGVGKWYNKVEACKLFGIDPNPPLICFIGRFAYEKGADMLEEIFGKVLYRNRNKINVLILGSGSDQITNQIRRIQSLYPNNFGAYLGYDEAMAHKIYAASDFILMPSRVEPCGLNQLYALKYGTMPIVSYTGGLKDTVKDVSQYEGYGLVFEKNNPDAAVHAIERAIGLYQNHEILTMFRHRMMAIDNSWQNSISKYNRMYQSVLN